ncbi:AAA family ATPase [Rhizobium leguminosarum bv. viciae]|uniref:AAA family ATPase n=1 Tax=Rhizobium leguminosarum TaxID=384 RepID=UPI001039EDE6|nr:ATP-binding protein [Rhizobium leguminosarum]MBY5340444.1 AAA family ATPase [Rhizobium leguminosarum]NKK49345.1 AAA family ATPase [Rhizobium leguminosarum bv. viciae]TBY90884.1 AAA family ATPase [Rhizobium leguminosarum bv. viciae]
MDKFARLFIHRLHHLARREARRIALRNGLLEGRIVDVDGHLLCRYSPAFDTTRLSGDPIRDAAWFRRNFGAWLVAPKENSPGSGGDVAATVEISAVPFASRLVAFPRVRRGALAQDAIPSNGIDRRAYAVGLVDRAAAPLISHIVTALVLARAVRSSGRPLREIVHTLTRVTPVVTLHAPLDGFEREVTRLLEKSRWVPGGPFVMIESDHMFNDDHFDVLEGETRRRLMTFTGAGVHRVTGNALRRRMLSVLSRELPILALAEKRSDIPSLLRIAADLSLETGKLDRRFVTDLVEVLYPEMAIETLGLPSDSDARWLSLEDLVLAFRPGRHVRDVLHILATLIERNRGDFEEEDGDGGDKASRSTPSNTSTEKASGSDEKPKSSETESNGRWKRDKPSGAEVIQPEPLPTASEIGRKSPVTVEILSGYGKAKEWALDLKADLDDYRASILAWSQMSTKLLLSGPPGTGKTTFARALCNSLQIPLVVTSVSTWLQGGHLNDVIDKMAKTFIEARAMAPAILFIDEIDGIGKRQQAEREYADYWNAIVNKALELLDGAVKSEGLIIVGATNRPGDIDEAIKRSGRLETHIEIPKPDVPTLAEILAHHLGDDVKALIGEPVADAQADADDGFSLKKMIADHLKDEAESERKGAGR